MASPIESPSTRILPVTARSPLIVISPVKEEMEASRSSKDKRPTANLPVTVSSGTWTGKVVINFPDAVAYSHTTPDADAPSPPRLGGERGVVLNAANWAEMVAI